MMKIVIAMAVLAQLAIATSSKLILLLFVSNVENTISKRREYFFFIRDTHFTWFRAVYTNYLEIQEQFEFFSLTDRICQISERQF